MVCTGYLIYVYTCVNIEIESPYPGLRGWGQRRGGWGKREREREKEKELMNGEINVERVFLTPLFRGEIFRFCVDDNNT